MTRHWEIAADPVLDELERIKGRFSPYPAEFHQQMIYFVISTSILPNESKK